MGFSSAACLLPAATLLSAAEQLRATLGPPVFAAWGMGGPLRLCRASLSGRCWRSLSPPSPACGANPEPRLLRRIAQTMPWDPLAVSVISRNPGGSRRRSWRARLDLGCRRCRCRCAPRHSGDLRETDKTSEHRGNKTHVTVHPISILADRARTGLRGRTSPGGNRSCSFEGAGSSGVVGEGHGGPIGHRFFSRARDARDR